MRRGTRRTILGALWIGWMMLIALAVAAGVAMAVGGIGSALLFLALAGVVGLGSATLWIAAGLVTQHFDALERLRSDLLPTDAGAAGLPHRWRLAGRERQDELGRLAEALSRSLAGGHPHNTLPDRRLAAILGAAAEGFILMTESGLVSLVNAAAGALFQARGLAVGRSILDVFVRESLSTAANRAMDAERPVTVSLHLVAGGAVWGRVAHLGDGNGFLLSFPQAQSDAGASVDFDLGLHDQPPESPPPAADTRLVDLPVLVLDTETTGLETETARIVSLGAVRMHGDRIYARTIIDWLINPGYPIPVEASAVHGLTDAMVADAPPLADVLPDLRAWVADTVVLGHRISFDLAVLDRECARADLDWRRPPSLDTHPLAAALLPDLRDFELETVAERLGIDPRGRHTALGDALVTAEIYRRLIPMLLDRGVTTFGQASALAAAPRPRRARRRTGG
jgi:DNA polymerase-3 subunit epsilon